MQCAPKGPGAPPACQELLKISSEELASGQIELSQGKESSIGVISLKIFQEYPYSLFNPRQLRNPAITIHVQDETGRKHTCWAYQQDLQTISNNVFNVTHESIEIGANDATHVVLEAKKQLLDAQIDSTSLDKLLSGKIPPERSEIIQKYFEPILKDIHANAVPLTKSARELFIYSFVEKLRSLPADQRIAFLHQCKNCKVDPEAENKIGNCLVGQMEMTIQIKTGWDKLVWNRDIPNNQTIFGKLLREVRQATDSLALQNLLIHHAYKLDWVMADNGHVRKTVQEKDNFAALADKLEQAAQHEKMDSRELTQLYLQEMENFENKLSSYPTSLVVRLQDKADLLKFFTKIIEKLPKEEVKTFLEEFRGSRVQHRLSNMLEKLNNSNLNEAEKRECSALKAKLNQRDTFHQQWEIHVGEKCGSNALVYNLVTHKMMAGDYDLIQDKGEVEAKINQDIEHIKALTSHFSAETVQNFKKLSSLSITQFAKELESVNEVSLSYLAVLGLYLAFPENTTKINQILEQFYIDYPGKLQQQNGVLKFEFPDYQYDTREQNKLLKIFSGRVHALGKEFPTDELAAKPEELLNAISLNFAHVATWLEREVALRAVEVKSKPDGVPLIRAKDFSLALTHPESEGLVKRGDMKKNEQGMSIPETNTEIIEQEGVCMGMSNGYQDHNIRQPNADHAGVALLKAGNDYPVTLVVQADGSGHGKEPAQVARAVVEAAIASAHKAFNLPFANAHDCIQLILHTMCETTKDIAKKCAQEPENYQSAATALIGAVIPNKETDHATAVFGNLGDCGAFIWKKDGTINRIGEDDLSEAYDVQSSGGQYGMNPNIALPNTAGYKFFTAQIEKGDRLITSSDGVIDNLHPRCFIDSQTKKALFNSPRKAFEALEPAEQISLRAQGVNKETLHEWGNPNAWNVSNPLLGKLVLMHMNKKITAIVQEARATTPKAATEALLTYARERGQQVRGQEPLKDLAGDRVPNRDYFQGLELKVYVDENKIPVKLDDYSVTIVDPFKFAKAK